MELTLEEVNFTVVAIPLDEVTERVLGEETVCFDIVCVDLKTLLDIVLLIINRAKCDRYPI